MRFIRCPYCGGKALLRNSDFVHGSRAKPGEQLYVCQNFPACDAYVGIHTGTKQPKGTLADSKLREKRVHAHKCFDLIWKKGIMSRKDAYKWLAARFGMDLSQAHIGAFGDYHCDQLILAAQEVLKNNHIVLQAAG